MGEGLRVAWGVVIWSPGRSGEKRPNVNVKIRSNRLGIFDGVAGVERNSVCQMGFLLGYWILFVKE